VLPTCNMPYSIAVSAMQLKYLKNYQIWTKTKTTRTVKTKTHYLYRLSELMFQNL